MAVPNLWRTQKQRYSLQAEICSHCANAVFPPRRVCPYCKRSVSQATPAKSEAAVFAFSMPTPASLAVAVTGDD